MQEYLPPKGYFFVVQRLLPRKTWHLVHVADATEGRTLCGRAVPTMEVVERQYMTRPVLCGICSKRFTGGVWSGKVSIKKSPSGGG